MCRLARAAGGLPAFPVEQERARRTAIRIAHTTAAAGRHAEPAAAVATEPVLVQLAARRQKSVNNAAARTF